MLVWEKKKSEKAGITIIKKKDEKVLVGARSINTIKYFSDLLPPSHRDPLQNGPPCPPQNQIKVPQL